MLQKPSVWLALSACLFASLAGAQSTNSFPEIHVDAKTLRVQKQAEEVYERTDYDRAFFIYRNELVPIGDKYAQYNVGFMYLTGKGVEEDRIAASAWYRLAAERGTKEFVHARDQLMRTLSDAQRAESDALFVKLRREYSDLVLLAKAIRADYEAMRSSTGSRLGGGGSAGTVLQLNSGGTTMSSADYYGRIERRIKARLAYIAEHTQINIIDLNVESFDLEDLEDEIDDYVGRLD